MLQPTTARLSIPEATAHAFADNLQAFAGALSASEAAMLAALLEAAMDPWSRSLLEPPALTAEETATLDRVAPPRSKGA